MIYYENVTKPFYLSHNYTKMSQIEYRIPKTTDSTKEKHKKSRPISPQRRIACKTLFRRFSALVLVSSTRPFTTFYFPPLLTFSTSETAELISRLAMQWRGRNAKGWRIAFACGLRCTTCARLSGDPTKAADRLKRCRSELFKFCRIYLEFDLPL